MVHGEGQGLGTNLQLGMTFPARRTTTANGRGRLRSLGVTAADQLAAVDRGRPQLRDHCWYFTTGNLSRSIVVNSGDPPRLPDPDAV
ncbi:hypothetical protein Enr13x_47640 [Stieleria neptunia]|uniref:Uncharacterized protein n=1 Tax=Stieleria neptunia TaxID=2527979 RepID=A0A518HVQ3_9BACT|nr:hypothetical protein Enr13x_47640 [Stieleria neptunia]